MSEITENKDSIFQVRLANEDTILIFSKKLIVKNLQPTFFKYVTLVPQSRKPHFLDITNTRFSSMQYVGEKGGLHYWLSLTSEEF